MKDVYVSTSAFEFGSLPEVINHALAIGLQHIELGANVHCPPDVENLLLAMREKHDIRFLIHNYFPPPENHFVLNLASPDNDIRKASLDLCRKAIELCARIESPFYSFHAGFCFHARPENLGARQSHLPRFSKQTARPFFMDSLLRLCDHAQKHGMNLAVENNVVTPQNRGSQGDDLYFGAIAEELFEIIDKVDSERLFALLDMGHLNVTARTLGVEPTLFVKLLASKIAALHLSDNDGMVDSHEAIRMDSWFWPLLDFMPPAAPWIIEVRAATLESIQKQVAICRHKVRQ